MVHVENFDTPEQMEARLATLRETANASLHPAQSALTYGDHWLRIADRKDNLVEFGYVLTHEEIVKSETDAGTSMYETAQVIGYVDLALEQGFLYGIARSRDNPEGEYGSTHKAHVWPIEPRLYEAAGTFGYDVTEFDEVASVLLQIALAGLRVQHIVQSMREGGL